MPWTNTFRGGQKLLRWRVRFLDGREPRSQHFVKEEDLRVIRCPHGPFFDRVESLRRMSPELVADVYLYPTDAGGRRLTAQPGWGCPCSCTKSADVLFYDGWPLLDAPFGPGERRRVGFVFLNGEEATAVLRQAGTFYLWEGHFIGEATVVT